MRYVTCSNIGNTSFTPQSIRDTGTIFYFSKLTQLTLFPRVSETSETNLRIQGTPFREHLVEHGFFQHAELVILTLMKGDEGVQTVEERADLALLVDSLGNADLRFKEIIWSNVEQSMVSGSLSRD